ncbi:MAG: hypothetical protein IIB62_10530 [Proteobacteria bacterium]|nr:hypothetical protein [Pseudomonadota bacterium]
MITADMAILIGLTAVILAIMGAGLVILFKLLGTQAWLIEQMAGRLDDLEEKVFPKPLRPTDLRERL